jgi:hypothetical protein
MSRLETGRRMHRPPAEDFSAGLTADRMNAGG